MAHSVSWTSTIGGFEAKPDGGETKRMGDDRIRELKLAIRERMEVGHVFADSSANQTHDGKHCVKSASDFVIYKSDYSTPSVTITDTGIKLGVDADLYAHDGTTRLFTRKRVIGWTMPGTLFTRASGVRLTDGILPVELPLDLLVDGETAPTVTPVSVRAVVLTPPNGANGSDFVEIDILRCPAGSNPEDGNFESILSSTLKITKGNYKSNTAAFVSGLTIAQNDLFAMTVVNIASGTPPTGVAAAGANLTVELILSA